MTGERKIHGGQEPGARKGAISSKERASYRPSSLSDCLTHLREYFDALAPVRDKWRKRNLGYHLELERIYKYHVPSGSRVLEVGCGTGDLLASLEPCYGLGIDISPSMIERAKARYPNLDFRCAAAETFEMKETTLDYVVLSDLLQYSFDMVDLFKALKPFCHARTRIIINFHSRVWQPIITLAENLGLKYRLPSMNWVTKEDVGNMLQVAGFETVQVYSSMLCPKRFPIISRFLNRVLAPFLPFRWFCLTNWIVARLPMHPLQKDPDDKPKTPTVSVICPCRNEAGNIPEIVKRLPQMGSHTELVFVEGHSKDDTYQACLDAKAAHADLDISVYQQPGKGKKDAVWLGFSKIKCDIMMILDADMTVPPEDLPGFYEVLVEGRAEFVNGSRLLYAMEGEAMRFLNLVGNKFFGLVFSFLLGQTVRDTLCGTKVLLRRDVERILAGQAYFGQFDPFGDFDLLFGASKLGLKILDRPIRYRERSYGETQISRFRHGWMLLKMCGKGLLRLKMR
ncbi:glycosyltransferase [Verrucomicrobiota bacterium]